MIWPSGGGALSAAVYDWFLRCCWFYVSTDSVCFSRFVTCCPASVLAGLQSAMLCVTEFLQSADCRRGRSSASGSRNHRTALYCRQAFFVTAVRKSASEVPLRACNSKRNFKDVQPPFHSGWRLRWFDCSAISLTLRRTADAVSDTAHRCPSLRSGHRPLTAADG